MNGEVRVEVILNTRGDSPVAWPVFRFPSYNNGGLTESTGPVTETIQVLKTMLESSKGVPFTSTFLSATSTSNNFTINSPHPIVQQSKDPVWKLTIGLSVSLGSLLIAAIVIAVMFSRRRQRKGSRSFSTDDGHDPKELEGSSATVPSEMAATPAIAELDSGTGGGSPPARIQEELETHEIVEAPDTGIGVPSDVKKDVHAGVEISEAEGSP
ncbi:hypothetical protein BJ508DRAFT_334857 [Ascobolus immersus RN42]|uniref:Uncharacterized protein n=1 Tax=Ascobolus immersus RN42 TaxID=1160509 RepID=A0A3N4HKH7_ASCIM|nr:hypothetical protein BJ508DRAFT_334857 [Ascobolus immersus RN42]